jgi:hypothetical protein
MFTKPFLLLIVILCIFFLNKKGIVPAILYYLKTLTK